MAEIYSPNKVIENLEKFAIKPFAKYNPVLEIVTSDSINEDDKSYIGMIKKKGAGYGATINVSSCDSSFAAIQQIQGLRDSSIVNGIIIVGSFGDDANHGLAKSIPSRLDIDCISPTTYGDLVVDSSPLSFRKAPCTAAACFKILEDIYKTNNFSNLNIAVIGRSLRVGRPLAEILIQYNATVTVFNSHSQIYDFSNFDAVVSAVGQPNYWTPNMFVRDQVVIDVGINVDVDGNICGDVDPSVTDILGKFGVITPVPGGVGPLTTTILFSKLFTTAALMHGEVL